MTTILSFVRMEFVEDRYFFPPIFLLVERIIKVQQESESESDLIPYPYPDHSYPDSINRERDRLFSFESPFVFENNKKTKKEKKASKEYNSVEKREISIINYYDALIREYRERIMYYLSFKFLKDLNDKYSKDYNTTYNQKIKSKYKSHEDETIEEEPFGCIA